MKYLKYLALTIISLYIVTFVFTAVKYPETFVYIPNVPMTATVFNLPPANNITEPGEACDGTDVNGYTCATVAAGFKSGTLTCNADRQSYNTSQCVAGDIIPAISCSQADVQTAIDSAVDGDIVTVPAGECTWITLRSNKPAITIDKSILLMGSGIDSTIINDFTNNGLGAEYNVDLIGVNNPVGKPFRITDFTFIRRDDGDSDTTIVYIQGDSMNWRVDHNKFIIRALDAAVFVRGNTYGLVDNNVYYGGGKTAVFGGSNAWMTPLALGTANSVYVETNEYFPYDDGTHVSALVVDANRGGRYVFRYNIGLEDRWILVHGPQEARGTFSYEIYENVVTDGPKLTDTPIVIRGGTGVIFNNTFNNFPAWNKYIKMYYDRSCSVGASACLCDGSCSIDGNEDATGYPCLDQIGRSTDFNSTDKNPQAFEPLYSWNNFFEEQPAELRLASCANDDNHIQENRDYYNDTVRPGYVPYPYPHPLTLIDPTPTTTYTLNITTENGTVSKNPDKATYVAGEQVILEAINNPGYTFTGWSGALTGSTNPVTITIGN